MVIRTEMLWSRTPPEKKLSVSQVDFVGFIAGEWQHSTVLYMPRGRKKLGTRRVARKAHSLRERIRLKQIEMQWLVGVDTQWSNHLWPSENLLLRFMYISHLHKSWENIDFLDQHLIIHTCFAFSWTKRCFCMTTYFKNSKNCFFLLKINTFP